MFTRIVHLFCVHVGQLLPNFAAFLLGEIGTFQLLSQNGSSLGETGANCVAGAVG